MLDIYYSLVLYINVDLGSQKQFDYYIWECRKG